MFITIEGIDGSGKTTLMTSLKKKLPDFHFTKEPTDDFQFANLKTLSSPYNSFYNFFLFTYDRLKHQDEIKGHESILCDRYLASSIAYEGPMIEKFFHGKDETIEWMLNVSKMVKMPDMIIYLDASLPVALERIRDNRKSLNFRGKQLSMLEEECGLKTIKEYYEYFFKNISHFVQKPIKIKIINANKTPEEVMADAERIIRDR
jgi:dTMP kinase